MYFNSWSHLMMRCSEKASYINAKIHNISTNGWHGDIRTTLSSDMFETTNPQSAGQGTNLEALYAVSRLHVVLRRTTWSHYAIDIYIYSCVGTAYTTCRWWRAKTKSEKLRVDGLVWPEHEPRVKFQRTTKIIVMLLVCAKYELHLRIKAFFLYILQTGWMAFMLNLWKCDL